MIRRKTNRAKRVAHGCRNHGPCEWCRGCRLHATQRRIDAAEDQLREHDQVERFSVQGEIEP